MIGEAKLYYHLLSFFSSARPENYIDIRQCIQIYLIYLGKCIQIYLIYVLCGMRDSLRKGRPNDIITYVLN